MAVNLSFIGGAGWQFFDNNGNPLSGGKIYTYAAGTTTPLATYTDRTGGTENANPVELDSAGRTPYQIWSTEGLLYKYIVKSSVDTQIRSWDNIGGSVVASDLGSNLALPSGSSLIGFVSNEANAVATTVQTELRRGFPIEHFRIASDPAPASLSDTTLVQRALDSGKSIYFTQNYYVDSVNATSVGQTIDFNGYGLVGIRAVGGGAQYVLAIMGRHMKWYNISVSANFGGYGCCVRWFSASAGAPAQYNNVYGMSLSYCGIGLLFGQEIGTPSIDAAQSENTIYGFTSRGLQTPFVGNQSNGFITLMSPILDCNPYEWATQPGYNATTWQTAALTINNVVGQVVIDGGEILKTSTQLGYGIRGLGILFLNTVFELACAQAYVMGAILIRDNTNGYMASDIANAFTIASGATGVLRLANINSSRGDGVGSYSGASFIAYESSTSAMDVVIEGGSILEWKFGYIWGRTVSLSNVKLTEATGATPIWLNDNANCLLRERGVDTSIYTTTGWYFVLGYGVGSGISIGASAPAGKNAASLALLATGVSAANSADVTSLATIRATSLKVIPGDLLIIQFWAKVDAGNSRVDIVYYDLAGTSLGATTLTGVLTGTWTKYKTHSSPPTGGAYAVIQVYGEVGTASLTDITVTRIAKSA